MTVPAVIQAMFDTTNAGDTAGFLACFTQDAFLSDWGRDFHGQDGIARWNQSDNIGVKSRLRIIDVSGNGPDYTLRIAVNGEGYNGEGNMAFTLKDGLIAKLVIS